MSLRALTRADACKLVLGGLTLGLAPSPSAAQLIPAIKVAVIAFEPSAEVYFAQQLGTFAKRGLDVQIQQMQSTGPISAAVVSGAVDIGYGSLPLIAAAHSRSVPFVVIAPASMVVAATRTAALLVRPDSTIRVAKDLNAKVVALPGLGSLNDYATRAWIDANGGDSTTVKFIEIAFPAMPAALDAGRVDAISVTEPFVTVAKKNGRIVAYPNEAVAKEYIGSGYFTTRQWANSHVDLVRRFAAAIRDTGNWANNNPDKVGDMLASYTKLDPAVIAATTRVPFAENLSASLMQPLIDAAAKYDKFTTFPAKELIYTPSP